MARTVDPRIRRVQALNLRLAGSTYREIARTMGYASFSACRRVVLKALHEHAAEPANDLRELELARLDMLQLAVWQPALAGDTAALDRVLAIQARRANLLGLDAPAPVSVTGAVAVNYIFDMGKAIDG